MALNRLARRGVWYCLALSGTMAGLARADEKRAYDLTEKAIALPSNEIQRKIELYSDAIEQAPQFYLPYSNRAICYLNYGLWDEAIKDATKAVDLVPDNPHPWGARGRAYAGKREFEKAFADLTRALELAKTDEDSRNLYNDRGNAYFSHREYDKAIRDYKQAVQIDKKFAKGWNNLGSAYRALGKYDDAFENLDKSIREDPVAARTFVNRARVYIARNDKVMGLSDLNKAVELDKDDVSALIDRGMFYFLSNDVQSARSDFAAAANKQPENPYAAIWRYVAHASLDLKDDARIKLQQYLKERKQTDFWPMPLVSLLLGQSKADDVLQAAKRVDGDLYQRERLAEAYYFLGLTALIDGDKRGYQNYMKLVADQKVPRVQEYVMATIGQSGWKMPEPPPPRPVPTDTNIQMR